MDVHFGRCAPTGRLPVTLPRSAEVLAVDANGVCASPNDVPGYDKDLYIAEELKDENGKAYDWYKTAHDWLNLPNSYTGAYIRYDVAEEN